MQKMKTNYEHRIAPDDRNYECKANERLVKCTTDKAEAGVDAELNYTLYITKDYAMVDKEVDSLIGLAKQHPELRYIVRFYGSTFALIGREALIPLFAKVREVENILLTADCWKKMDEQQIVNQDGVVSFAGVVKVPVTVEYTIFSNSIRYGVARTIDPAAPYYFGVHGFPNRNDDYFTIALVTQEEYDEMVRIYQPWGSQSNPTAEMFRNKYVENHVTVYEGWDLPDVVWVEGDSLPALPEGRGPGKARKG